MKKLLILICLVSMLMGVSACKKQPKEETKEFNQGDTVIEDGVIYTYYTEEYLVDKVIPFVKEDNYRPFVKEKNYKPYYNYYYYDMSDCDNLPAIPTSFEGSLYDRGGIGGDMGDFYYIQHSFFPETFYDFLKYCEPNHSPTSAYFYRLRDYFSYTLKGDSFIVSGYTKDLKAEVVIPPVVQNIPVRQIGFMAFANAPMQSLTFLSNDPSPSSYNLIHPYAIFRCKNLGKLKTDAKALSMAVATCPSLTKIQYIGLVQDCSLFDLPSLYSITDCDARPYDDKENGIAGNVSLHNTSGIRKSSIYDCPNVYSIQGYPLTNSGGITYYDNFYPYYVPSIPETVLWKHKLVLKDEFFSNLSWNSYVSLAYNPDTMELYLPFLNNGLNHSGITVSLDSNCKKIIEKED